MHGDARPARRGCSRLAGGFLGTVVLAAGLVIAPAFPAVADTTATPPPEAFALVDAGTGAVITARHLHEALPPASTVKIMTALVAVERLPLDATIPVSANAANREAMKIGMRTGTRWPFDQTMATLMMISANDSAYALAEAVGGGSISGFAALANSTARRYGMKDSTFGDPAGLSDTTAYEGGPKVSAYDLAIATRNALTVPAIARWAATTTYDFTDSSGQAHSLTNHDKFLPGNTYGYQGANGFKTGFTDAAGHTLVATAERGGRQCIAVILGSVDSGYTWAASLLDQCWRKPSVTPTQTILPAVAVSPYAARIAERNDFTTLAVGREGAKLAAATRTVTPETSAPNTNHASGKAARAPTTAVATPAKKKHSGGLITTDRFLFLFLLLLAGAVWLRRQAVKRQRARRIARRRARAKAMRSGSLPVVDGRYRTGSRVGPPVESRMRVRRTYIDLTEEERRPTRSTRPSGRPRPPRTPETAD
jgi:D-alanyl-D-alanine carboxypeptidase (penicillin-binding protein 5/6)